MTRKALTLLPAVAAVALLAGCSSNDSTTTDASATTAGTAPSSQTCPTTPAPADTEPQWTVDGTTGSVSVVGQTDTTAPLVTVDTPFSVDETEVKTLTEGDGKVVTDDSVVTVCYEGVNGRDGQVFDSAYQRGEPAAFPAQGVIPGFRQSLVGQKSGSTVAVVIPSKDGYPQGSGDGSILPGDTLIFALKILDAS